MHHLLLASFLAALNLLYHCVDSCLRLLIVRRFCLLHVFFDGLGGLDSQIIFYNIYILIDLGNLLVHVYKGQGKGGSSSHLLPLNTLCT